jgi:hypothetical protein
LQDARLGSTLVELTERETIWSSVRRIFGSSARLMFSINIKASKFGESRDRSMRGWVVRHHRERGS